MGTEFFFFMVELARFLVDSLFRWKSPWRWTKYCKYLETILQGMIFLNLQLTAVYCVTYRTCEYHTSNNVFSRFKCVHKMATEKSDDKLKQLVNKMRVWDTKWKIQKMESPELSMAWWQSMTRRPMTPSMIEWNCTMRTPLTTSTDTHMSAHGLRA